MWYYCYGYAPRLVQWITTTKMCMLAKVFRTLLVYLVLNKYHWCLWKGILFLTYKSNCVQYLFWWLFKSRVTMSTLLGIPILQLKTQKQKNHTKRLKKKKCQKTETITPQISINNLKMGPRAYIGHKLQIWKWEKWRLDSSHRLVRKDIQTAGSHIPQNFSRVYLRYYILAANDKTQRIRFGKKIE